MLVYFSITSFFTWQGRARWGRAHALGCYEILQGCRGHARSNPSLDKSLAKSSTKEETIRMIRSFCIEFPKSCVGVDNPNKTLKSSYTSARKKTNEIEKNQMNKYVLLTYL